MTGFSGINVALQTLLSQQAALEITQNNVANANTPGYHRQQAVLKAGFPTRSMAFTNTSGVQNIGTGVYVSSIKRYESNLIDTQYRRQVADNAKFSTLSSLLNEVETNLGDTSSDGIAQRVDDFFSGWQTVATDPDLAANRADLLEKAKSMVEAFHNRMTSLIKIQTDQNTTLTQYVDDINAIGKQLGELNAEIGRSQTAVTQPNALLDERDRLLDQLSSYIGTTVHVQDNNEVLVSIGGHALVSGSKAFELQATPVASNNNLVKINWADDGQKTALTGLSGEVGGILYGRDTVIENQLSSLNDTATSIMNRVNALHLSGFDLDGNAGINFFSSLSSVVNFSGNLDIYAGIGATHNVTMDVQDTNGISHQVALTLTKTATREWTYSTATPGASIVGNADLTAIPNGTITFDASGNVTSTTGRILFGGNATSIDTSELRQSSVSASNVGVSYQNQAMTIRVNPMLTSYRQIAAATVTNAPGDGNNALAIANSIDTITSGPVAGLAAYQDPVAANGEKSIRSWNTLRTTDLALEQRHAETGVSDTTSIMSAMNDQRESVIGVNMDEEAANMVKYQRAYQAAARLMNTFDQMLELVVTNLGMVGR
jgi:flagellar hook-associated protein 1 FlgK